MWALSGQVIWNSASNAAGAQHVTNYLVSKFEESRVRLFENKRCQRKTGHHHTYFLWPPVRLCDVCGRTCSTKIGLFSYSRTRTYASVIRFRDPLCRRLNQSMKPPTGPTAIISSFRYYRTSQLIIIIIILFFAQIQNWTTIIHWEYRSANGVRQKQGCLFEVWLLTVY